jgi:hypothetical protein
MHAVMQAAVIGRLPLRLCHVWADAAVLGIQVGPVHVKEALPWGTSTAQHTATRTAGQPPQ